jgi:hypothetical protein
MASMGGTPRGRQGGQVEVEGLNSLKGEVSKLHDVIAEMAEREERLLRMLQLPDVKPVRASLILSHVAKHSCCARSTCTCTLPVCLNDLLPTPTTDDESLPR